MSDRRFHRANDRVAHTSLGDAPGGHKVVAGHWQRVGAPLADLCAAPGGARDRQLLHGTRFRVLERRGDHAFGFDADDGYCGWLEAALLAGDHPVTHRITAPATHCYSLADIKSSERFGLSLGARVQVLGAEGAFARTPHGHVPARHLGALDAPMQSPVAVARLFLGTPYLWGGNSSSGIDCSGLVQIARRACGLPCPPDSDLQAAMPGVPVAAGHEAPGDLVFWKGHVALIGAPGRIIHANAWHMAVVEEELAVAEARIAADGGPVVLRLRANG